MLNQIKVQKCQISSKRQPSLQTHFINEKKKHGNRIFLRITEKGETKECGCEASERLQPPCCSCSRTGKAPAAGAGGPEEVAEAASVPRWPAGRIKVPKTSRQGKHFGHQHGTVALTLSKSKRLADAFGAGGHTPEGRFQSLPAGPTLGPLTSHQTLSSK